MEGGSSKVFATAPASIGEKRSTIPPHVCACARSTCRRESGQVAARTDTSKGDAKGDAGVLVPTDGGVDLLARPRNGGILFFEQLLRPHIRRKGLHGDIRWWPNTDRLGRRRSSARLWLVSQRRNRNAFPYCVSVSFLSTCLASAGLSSRKREYLCTAGPIKKKTVAAQEERAKG